MTVDKYQEIYGPELAKFLEKPAGQNLIAVLMTLRPAAKVCPSEHETFVSLGEVRGAESVVSNIMRLSQTPVPKNPPEMTYQTGKTAKA